jgi:hypothetical protein
MKGSTDMTEDNGRNWKRPVSVRYATIIKETGEVSVIANITDINPQPPFLDKPNFEIREVGPDVKIGDRLVDGEFVSRDPKPEPRETPRPVTREVQEDRAAEVVINRALKTAMRLRM